MVTKVGQFWLYYGLLDEKNCEECEAALTDLEEIDDAAHDLKISFVKIADNRLARKYGVAKPPALVYFRRKYPAIYRGMGLPSSSCFIPLAAPSIDERFSSTNNDRSVARRLLCCMALVARCGTHAGYGICLNGSI